MDEAAKKTALRMIPYGLFVIGTKNDETVTAFAGNWLTQASFTPPLVVLGAKAGTASKEMIDQSGLFCVNVLETGSTALASKFFAHVEPDGVVPGVRDERGDVVEERSRARRPGGAGGDEQDRGHGFSMEVG